MVVAVGVVVGVVVLVSAAALLVRRAGKGGEGEDARFAMARSLTTMWSVSATGSVGTGVPSTGEAATTADTAG